jgi:hypothetical protein
LEKILEKIRCEREIVGENFEKRKKEKEKRKQVRETIKKTWKEIFWER